MADEVKINNGSYKGIPIVIDSSSLAGGHKVSIKQFPNKDTQSVETLGLIPRKYSAQIVITDKVDEDYFAYRDKLLATLEERSPGELIHPFYGRIDDVVAVSYSINEAFSSFGDTTISVDFEANNNTGIPQRSESVVTEIATANDSIIDAVKADIGEAFNVTESFAGNFTAAVDKVNDIIDSANDALSFIGDIADTIDEVSAEIGQFSANVNSLVKAPLQLADAVTGLFESVGGLYSSARSTFEVFTGFFGFGDDDTPIIETTAGRAERKKNDGVLNGAVAALSIGYAYKAAVQIEYETTEEIDEVAASLDVQFQAAQESESSQEVKDAVTEMRIKILKALAEARINTPQLFTVTTKIKPARILAFEYYGNDDNGETIVNLNQINDVSFVEGQVKMVTINES